MARFAFARPQVVAFTPAVSLAAFWGGGEIALLGTAILFPLLSAWLAPDHAGAAADQPARDADTGLPQRPDLLNRLDHLFRLPADAGESACLVVDVLNHDAIAQQYGASGAKALRMEIAKRLKATSRDHDVIHALGPTRFGFVLPNSASLDLEAAIQLSRRLLAALDQPLTGLDERAPPMADCAVGFCLASRSPEPSGHAILDAAESALGDAVEQGPGSIRAFVRALHHATATTGSDSSEALHALERRQIAAWFQPQVSTDTGEITGFEALARWMHPEKGPLSPDHFLPALEAAGAMERLSTLILDNALAAVRKWDLAGLEIPHVSINLSEAELASPDLVDRISWELDRYALAPERLAIEVPESALSGQAEEMVIRGLETLRETGCRIDLDNFGTCNASITAIGRFAINRLKIDRTFVSGVDHDPEQKRVVSAMLTMAEQLGLETIAEGIESSAEHATLAQLGCGNVQGFGIARPMPLENTMTWIEDHRSGLAQPPVFLSRKS
ncbi:EAL domain, c-di-GMP-specific phosphodiesterase class I (or its enzymatically inactive variant) [Poseidonocella sedimentorum]|uniref:EAL domain, c-di-GMP-specific phosphodiesterase class I (Or its enzymatically inactive variant) n=1 Tax=Poseidonocella sedimentorum TaxID=871652 RepID=A0A1I6DMG4_9RHOB|nr:EAL domain, c-di-GMP-specific phosphodiesterase class I (or its enzymatically inactive variant) [Poseidonocella sedimentorum]